MITALSATFTCCVAEVAIAATNLDVMVWGDLAVHDHGAHSAFQDHSMHSAFHDHSAHSHAFSDFSSSMPLNDSNMAAAGIDTPAIEENTLDIGTCPDGSEPHYEFDGSLHCGAH